jgi:4-carboxymuconolactone decarboxylase
MNGSSRQAEKGDGAASGGGLDRGVRALVRVSGAVAGRDQARLDAVLEEALENRPRDVEEVLVQSYLFVGFPSALNAMARWRRISGRPAPPPRTDDPGLRLDRGEDVCRRVYGDQYERLRSNIAELHPDLDRWMVEEGYGKVLGREGLTLTERELCILALLAVQEVPVQLHSHLRGALEVGATPRQVQAALVAVNEMVSPRFRPRAQEIWDRVRSPR